MSNAHPHSGPQQRKGQGKVISIAFPFELYQELAQQAQITGESVATCAAQLLSEGIRKLPPDRG